MKVYLAGPMTGIEDWNFPAFIDGAACLREAGHEVISPAEHDLEMGYVVADVVQSTAGPFATTTVYNITDSFDREAVLAWDCEQIPTCDAVVLLPGWQESDGVAREMEAARRARLYCYELDRFLAEDTDAPSWAIQPQVLPGEIRVVNETTGGEKGQKLARFDLLPAGPLQAVAEHFGRGAAKYEDRNWERGYDWSLSFGALQRHAWAFWGGEDIDAETGSPHLAAVAFHALALLEFATTHPELDDRPNHVDEFARLLAEEEAIEAAGG